MNRRSFFTTLATAAAGFTILPPATTYQRIWRARRAINPEWLEAEYDVEFWSYKVTMDGQLIWGCDLDRRFRRPVVFVGK